MFGVNMDFKITARVSDYNDLLRCNDINSLSANPTKWSNTLKQFVDL